MSVENTVNELSTENVPPIIPLSFGAAGLLLATLIVSSVQDIMVYSLLAVGTVCIGVGTVLLVRNLDTEIGFMDSLCIFVTGGFIAYPLQELGYMWLSVIPLLVFAVIGSVLIVRSSIRAVRST